MNNLTQKIIMLNEQSNTKDVNSISPLGKNWIDALKINLVSHLSWHLIIINIMIIMLTKLWLKLSILLYRDDDDENHHNRNAMKIANIIYIMNAMMNFIRRERRW
jgi:hypothetical protein